jgi:hypothetical protein
VTIGSVRIVPGVHHAHAFDGSLRRAVMLTEKTASGIESVKLFR